MQNLFFIEKYSAQRQEEIMKHFENEAMVSEKKRRINNLVKILVFLFFPDSSRTYEKMILDEKKYPGALKVVICIIYAILIMVFISFLVK
jgi:hypothetical protein